MGLDMYAYKIKKMDDEFLERVKNEEAVEGCIYIPDEDIDEEMYADIIPFCVPMEITNSYINIRKIKEERNIPEEAHIVGQAWGKGKVHFFFDNGSDVDITREDIENNYTEKVKETEYVTRVECVGYWRREDSLNDTLEDIYGDYVENLGYYKCNEDMLKVMTESCDSKSFGFNYGLFGEVSETDDVFYHIWF